MFFDQRVEILNLLRGAFEEFGRKPFGEIGRGSALPELFYQLARIFLAHFPLEEHLHGVFARF
jgi:hypothetical protein